MTDNIQKASAILNRVTISPEELLETGILPLKRASIYQACQSGEIECFKIGRKYVIPTAPLRKMLGIEAA